MVRSLSSNNTQSYFTVAQTVRSTVPLAQRQLRTIKEIVLGKTYSLSVVFIGDRRSRILNKTYRHKDTPTNVLSFPLTAASGEIFINIAQAQREAQRQHTPLAAYLAFLFIHGTLHLKGMRHGATMEAEEQKLLKRFGF